MVVEERPEPSGLFGNRLFKLWRAKRTEHPMADGAIQVKPVEMPVDQSQSEIVEREILTLAQSVEGTNGVGDEVRSAPLKATPTDTADLCARIQQTK